MSQKKVDEYKASKKTRKQDAEKAKKKKTLVKWTYGIIGLLIAGAIIAGVAVTFANMSKDNSETVEETSESAFQLSDYAEMSKSAENDKKDTNAKETTAEVEETSAEETTAE